MSSEFKAIQTQEELDTIIGDRLHRERAKYADYEVLKSKVAQFEPQFAEVQKALQEKDQALSQAQERIQAFELRELKQRVALESGLPYQLAGRLSGQDEASLRADAECLGEFLKRSAPLAPLRATEPQTPSKDSAYRQMLQQIKGD